MYVRKLPRSCVAEGLGGQIEVNDNSLALRGTLRKCTALHPERYKRMAIQSLGCPTPTPGTAFDYLRLLSPFDTPHHSPTNFHNLQLITKVNGEIRQNESTSDMVWSIKQLMVHLTRGRTLRAGTVFMTGTPSGVGWFHPSGFLKDGDEVEISIDRLGSLSNKIVFS